MSDSEPHLDIYVGEDQHRPPEVELCHDGQSINLTVKGMMTSIHLPDSLSPKDRIALLRNVRRVIMRGAINDRELAEKVIYQHVRQLSTVKEDSASRGALSYVRGTLSYVRSVIAKLLR